MAETASFFRLRESIEENSAVPVPLQPAACPKEGAGSPPATLFYVE